MKEPQRIVEYSALIQDLHSIEDGIRIGSLYRALLGAAYKEQSIWREVGNYLQSGFYASRPYGVRDMNLLASSLGEMAKQNTVFGEYMLRTFFLNPTETSKYDRDGLEELLEAFPDRQVATVIAEKLSQPHNFPQVSVTNAVPVASPEINALITAFNHLDNHGQQKYFSAKLVEYLKEQKEKNLIPFIQHALSTNLPNTRIFVYEKLTQVIQAFPSTFGTFYPLLVAGREDASALVHEGLVKQIALLDRKLKNDEATRAMVEIKSVFPAEVDKFFQKEQRFVNAIGYLIDPASVDEMAQTLIRSSYPNQVVYETLHANIDNYPLAAHTVLNLIREQKTEGYNSGMRHALESLFNSDPEEWPLFVAAVETTVNSPYYDAQNLLYYSFVCRVRGTEGEDLLRRLRLENRSARLNAFVGNILKNAIGRERSLPQSQSHEVCQFFDVGYSETTFQGLKLYEAAERYFPNAELSQNP